MATIYSFIDVVRRMRCVPRFGVLLVAWAAIVPQGARGHETDQFSVPTGQTFADLGGYFTEQIHATLGKVVKQTNDRIRTTLRDGVPTQRTTVFHSPEYLARTVYRALPGGILSVEILEGELRRPEVRDRFPGLLTAYQPATWIYHHWAMLIDVTKLPRLFRTSTIQANGVYFGTDKWMHFSHLGIFYFNSYRRALAQGSSPAEALQAAVDSGTGFHPLMSENTFLGSAATGVRSNADLQVNYVGMKFFINLTEPVRLQGRMRPPLLVRDGAYWRLNDHVTPQSDFLTAYITDHWDEALNPNQYVPWLEEPLREELAKRCPSILAWYRHHRSQPQSRDDYLRLAERLRTDFGEDYGYAGDPETLISVANTCFVEDAPRPSEDDFDALVEVAAGEWDSADMAEAGSAASPTHTAERVDIDAQDPWGRSRLWWAARDGDFEMVEALVLAGARLDVADVDGETALHAAARHGHALIAEQLLAAGANPDPRSDLRATPLHLAARQADHRMAELLLMHGAAPDQRDVFGVTPLHDAASGGAFTLARVLVRHGANPAVGDVGGRTAVDRAARRGDQHLLALFQQAGGTQRPNRPASTMGGGIASALAAPNDSDRTEGIGASRDGTDD